MEIGKNKRMITISKKDIEIYEGKFNELNNNQIPKLRGYAFELVLIPIPKSEFKKTDLFKFMYYNLFVKGNEIAEYLEYDEDMKITWKIDERFSKKSR